MGKNSKKYRRNSERTQREPRPLSDAIAALKKFDNARFDESVEVAVKLGIDPKNTQQNVRGAFSFPHGIGRQAKVIAFADGAQAEEAQAAGAVAVGGEDLAKRIQDGWLDFDVAVAHPSMMRHVGRLGRILGPQGKMPSPKAGTVTDDVGRAVREFVAGKVKFSSDKGGNVHALVGKKSFPPEKLQENIEAFLDYLRGLKPPSAKGTYLQKVTVAATMSPGVRVQL